MENYLHHIQTHVDFLITIQSPLFDLQLIQDNTSGFPHDEYHNFVTTYYDAWTPYA